MNTAGNDFANLDFLRPLNNSLQYLILVSLSFLDIFLQRFNENSRNMKMNTQKVEEIINETNLDVFLFLKSFISEKDDKRRKVTISNMNRI